MCEEFIDSILNHKEINDRIVEFLKDLESPENLHPSALETCKKNVKDVFRKWLHSAYAVGLFHINTGDKSLKERILSKNEFFGAMAECLVVYSVKQILGFDIIPIPKEENLKTPDFSMFTNSNKYFLEVKHFNYLAPLQSKRLYDEKKCLSYGSLGLKDLNDVKYSEKNSNPLDSIVIKINNNEAWIACLVPSIFTAKHKQSFFIERRRLVKFSCRNVSDPEFIDSYRSLRAILVIETVSSDLSTRILFLKNPIYYKEFSCLNFNENFVGLVKTRDGWKWSDGKDLNLLT